MPFLVTVVLYILWVVWMGRFATCLTIIFAENESVDAPEAENVEEVPRGGRDPRRVERHQLNAALQHRLEPQSQREWNL